MGGQCLDSIYNEFGSEIENADLYREILGLWERNHLNDMNAGVPAQLEALKDFNGDYTAQCEYLKSIGLYEVDGYKYGHNWIYRSISDADLNRIKELVSGN